MRRGVQCRVEQHEKNVGNQLRKGGLIMKRTLRVLSCFLAVLILSTVTAYADNNHKHTLRTITSYEYEEKNPDQHTVIKWLNTYCADASCGYEYKEQLSRSLQAHTFSGWTWTGNSYHSGSLHYYLYQKTCVSCKYVETEWRSASCPGGNNGGCVYPNSVPNVKE